MFTPAPGGGTSAAQALTITGPGLTASATSSPPGGLVTATLSNGPAEGAWLALAQVGSAASTYLQYTFVTAGVTNRTWDVTMPTALGNYEFRVYLLNTYTVIARSAAVAVVNINPTPAIGGLTPASLAAGSAVGTLTVTGTGFVSGITATVGGQARTVTGVTPTQAQHCAARRRHRLAGQRGGAGGQSAELRGRAVRLEHGEPRCHRSAPRPDADGHQSGDSGGGWGGVHADRHGK